MNKERRDKLRKVVTHVDNALALIEEVNQGEADAIDSIPVGLQSSYDGKAYHENLEKIDAMQSELQAMVHTLDDMLTL